MIDKLKKPDRSKRVQSDEAESMKKKINNDDLVTCAYRIPTSYKLALVELGYKNRTNASHELRKIVKDALGL